MTVAAATACRVHPLAFLHPLSHTGADVTIGARTKVWQFASVIRGAAVGCDCTVATNVLIDGAVVGDRCKVEHCAAVGPGIRLGDDVFVAPFVMFCNDVWPSTDQRGYDMAALMSGKWTVVVKERAAIGAHAIVMPGVTIGAGAMVAAGAVVSCDVPDRHLYRRDGRIVPIDQREHPTRMRLASPC